MLSIFAKVVFTFFAALAYTQLSQAQDFTLGQATISGPGCPAGSAAVAVSPDQKTISILFDKFSIEKPAGSAGGRVACNIRIDVHNISPGYVLDTTAFDIRGFAQIPNGAVAQLNTRGGAEGAGRDNRVVENLTSSGDFNIRRVTQQSHVRRCVSRPNDQIKLTIALLLSPRGVLQEDGMITVDTADLGTDSGLDVGVALKQCDSKSGKIKDIRREERAQRREERQVRLISNRIIFAVEKRK